MCRLSCFCLRATGIIGICHTQLDFSPLQTESYYTQALSCDNPHAPFSQAPTHVFTTSRAVSIECFTLELKNPAEEGKKDCKSQRGLRTLGEHRSLNELNRAHIGSQRLMLEERDLQGSASGPLHICCGCQLENFVGRLTVGGGMFLTPLPTPGILSLY